MAMPRRGALVSYLLNENIFMIGILIQFICSNRKLFMAIFFQRVSRNSTVATKGQVYGNSEINRGVEK